VPFSAAENPALALARYRNLEECILTEVRWLDWGSSLECCFDYIWADEEEAVLPESEFRHIVVRFEGVQELRLVGGLTDTMIRHPKGVNWGLGEIAVARSQPADITGGDVPLHHVTFLWEGERRLDVVAARVTVEER
jgi:hypothetical protein